MYCFEELRITPWEITHFSPVSYFHHNLSPSLTILSFNGLFSNLWWTNKDFAEGATVLHLIQQKLKVFYTDCSQISCLHSHFETGLMVPILNCTICSNNYFFAKAHPARPRVKNRHQGNLEVVQVCCWLAPHGRSIEASLLWSSISTDVVGEQIYNRPVLGFFGSNQIRC